jgi:hypothetical protein
MINTHWHHEKVETFVKRRVNSYSLLVNSERNAGKEEGGKVRRSEGKKIRREDGKKWPVVL